MSNEDTFEDDLLEDRIKTNVWDPALLRRMLAYSKPYWLRVVLGVVLVGVTALFAVLPPALMGAVLDVVFTTESSSLSKAVARLLSPVIPGLTEMSKEGQLWVFAGLFLFVRLGAFFTEWGNGYLLAGFGQRVIYDIRMQLFRHIHSLSLSYFHRQPVGRLVTRTTNDVGSMEEMFSAALVTILKDLAMLAGIIIFLLLMNLKLGLITLSVVPLMVVGTLIFRKYARDAYRKWRAALSRINAFTAEVLGGIRVVQLFHKEKRNDKAYDDIGRDYKRHFIDQRRAWAIFRPANTTLSAAGIALVIWFGGAAVIDSAVFAQGMSEEQAAAAGLFTVGLLFAFIGYAELFFTPIRDLTEKFDIMQGAMTSAERIFTILDEKREVVDRPGAESPGRVKGAVEFVDVEFEYKPNEPVLKGMSFKIEPGQTIAVVGHTGAGKTTLINLICRFYDVQGGKVMVDGRDVRDCTLKGLRENIATVHQDVFLFAGTILDNIRLGDESITLEQVRKACDQVGATGFIERLEGGFDAAVEEGGKTFSAGERQLLSFARALVFDPAILILDEATSSIDTHTEEMIQAAMEKLTKGRTSIVIAHRLSTIQKADRILVLHKGKLAESGNHQQLLAERGIYYRLYQLQYQQDEEPKPDSDRAEAVAAEVEPTRAAAAATRGKVAESARIAEQESRASDE